MKRFFVILLAVITMVAATLTGAATTYAASIYDDTVQLQEEPFTIAYNNGNHATTYSYDELMSEFAVCALADYTNFLVAQSNPNGAVAVVQTYDLGTSPREVWIYYSVNGKDDTELQFASGSNNTRLEFQSPYTSSDIKAVKMRKYSSGDMWCQTGFNESNIFSSGSVWVAYKSSSPTGLNFKPFINQFPINYPSGYEGDEIPEKAPQTYKPEILWTVGTDGRFGATPMVTDLKIPTVGGGSLPPKIMHKLYDDSSNEEVFSKTDIMSAPVSFNLPSYGQYRYEVTYVHPGVPWAPFEQGTKFIKVIATFNYDGTKVVIGGTSGDQCTENGNEVNCAADPVDVLECVTDTAPYINFADCRDQFLRIGNILTFNTISFISIENSGCRTLGTIGDWLPLENKTVCPQVPAEIRQVVTPFVTFGTMLLIVYGVIKITRDNT